MRFIFIKTFLIQKINPMKNFTIFFAIVIFLISCSPSVTMQQAANRNYRGARSVR